MNTFVIFNILINKMRKGHLKIGHLCGCLTEVQLLKPENFISG